MSVLGKKVVIQFAVFSLRWTVIIIRRDEMHRVANQARFCSGFHAKIKSKFNAFSLPVTFFFT